MVTVTVSRRLAAGPAEVVGKGDYTRVHRHLRLGGRAVLHNRGRQEAMAIPRRITQPPVAVVPQPWGVMASVPRVVLEARDIRGWMASCMAVEAVDRVGQRKARVDRVAAGQQA